MKLSRRDALKLAAALGLAPALLTACDDGDDPSSGRDGGGGDAGPLVDMEAPDDGLPRYAWEGEPGPAGTFAHGIASGDPLPDAVVLWTRVSPEEDGPVEVFWEIAARPDFVTRAAVGTVSTEAARDYTVKVDATDLEAGATYYYRFSALGRTSATGRTRTAPAGAVDRLRFAVVSCASLGHGWFHAYADLAEQPDIDAVLHLGDYIYEYASGEYGDARPYEPAHEIVTLEDYRTRYAQYRRDPDLQGLHRQHPMIAIWDDHESANNSWSGGADNHTPGDEGDWADRRAAAAQAWFEWLPVRDTDDGHIYRKFAYGDLADLVMLDTRLWGREQQGEGVSGQEERWREDRQLLGQDQEAWLREQLLDSQARWKVLGQQVMMGQLQVAGTPLAEGGGNALNLDQWDGYVAARTRLFDLLADNEIDDVVVLTGDIHTSWAMDLNPDAYNPEAYDPETGAGSLAVEFVVTAITSPGLPALNPALVDLVLTNNPHMKWAELSRRGYAMLDLDRERAQCAWFLLPYVDMPERPEVEFASAFASYTGENRLVLEDAPAAPRAEAPALAPEDA